MIMKDLSDKDLLELKNKLENKIAALDNEQTAIKVLLNSLYGAFGTPYFRLFDVRIAEAITMTGQLTIQWAERRINTFLNRVFSTNKDWVLGCDTDSLFLGLSDVVKKLKPVNTLDFINKFCLELQKELNSGYNDLFNIMGAFKPRMNMKREIIADRGFWTAKKRYALHVLDSEGVRYAKPKLKIMGIEAVKSSTPKLVRDKLKIAFDLLLTATEKKLEEFIISFYNEFCKAEPEAIAFPRSVNDIGKWKTANGYSKGCPIQVRSAIMYNKLLDEFNLKGKYDIIKSGSKLKFIYLRIPNPIMENVIGFSDVLPKEFELHQFIDYDMQFDKTFLSVLKQILISIKWSQAAISLNNKNTCDMDTFFQ